MEEEVKYVSFKKLIEAIEATGLYVSDIHLERTGAPNTMDYKQFTGSIVIKTFPVNCLING